MSELPGFTLQGRAHPGGQFQTGNTVTYILGTMKSGEPLGSIVGKAWSFLWDVVNRPYLEDDAYPEEKCFQLMKKS